MSISTPYLSMKAVNCYGHLMVMMVKATTISMLLARMLFRCYVTRKKFFKEWYLLTFADETVLKISFVCQFAARIFKGRSGCQ